MIENATFFVKAHRNIGSYYKTTYSKSLSENIVAVIQLYIINKMWITYLSYYPEQREGMDDMRVDDM